MEREWPPVVVCVGAALKDISNSEASKLKCGGVAGSQGNVKSNETSPDRLFYITTQTVSDCNFLAFCLLFGKQRQSKRLT